uniref:Uncharacterized protein n=1 Tax=Kwoniella bestiolae CBS 10118 TaxID=1296100 RepID=A0A1B9G472_9TREE|nr:hypothetical protein I302_03486 [Kwoniella bestiolae CBS 10118]OCF25813.1 hypothetical protein I302_03486 [Kwoniella bestiolae CBS 10118]
MMRTCKSAYGFFVGSLYENIELDEDNANKLFRDLDWSLMQHLEFRRIRLAVHTKRVYTLIQTRKLTVKDLKAATYLAGALGINAVRWAGGDFDDTKAPDQNLGDIFHNLECHVLTSELLRSPIDHEHRAPMSDVLEFVNPRWWPTTTMYGEVRSVELVRYRCLIGLDFDDILEICFSVDQPYYGKLTVEKLRAGWMKRQEWFRNEFSISPFDLQLLPPEVRLHIFHYIATGSNPPTLAKFVLSNYQAFSRFFIVELPWEQIAPRDFFEVSIKGICVQPIQFEMVAFPSVSDWGIHALFEEYGSKAGIPRWEDHSGVAERRAKWRGNQQWMSGSRRM